jgi:hypothetical protein
VSEVPSVFSVGGVQLSAAPPEETSTTLIEKARSAVVARPSLTLIVTLAYEPTCVALGVPESKPLLVLNVAQLGRFAIV